MKLLLSVLSSSSLFFRRSSTSSSSMKVATRTTIGTIGLILPFQLSAFGLLPMSSSSSSSSNNRRGGSHHSFGTSTLTAIPRRGFSSLSSSSTTTTTTNHNDNDNDTETTNQKNQTFPTWSYNNPCTSMEWSSLVPTEMSFISSSSSSTTSTTPSSSSSSSSSPTSVVEKVLGSDFIVIGLMAPPPPSSPKGNNNENDENENDNDNDTNDNDSNDNDDNDDNDDDIPTVVELSQFIQDIEKACGGGGGGGGGGQPGILSSFLEENYKIFKNGKKLGSTTPVLRVMVVTSTNNNNNNNNSNDNKDDDGTTTTTTTTTTMMKRIVFVGLGTSNHDQQQKTENDDDDDHDDNHNHNKNKKLKKKKENNNNMGIVLGKTLATQCLSQKQIKTCSFILPDEILYQNENNLNNLNQNNIILQDLSSTFYSTLYTDNRYKSKTKQKKVVNDLKSINIYVDHHRGNDNDNDNQNQNNQNNNELSLLETIANEAIKDGYEIAKGIYLTKDIVNAPHNVLNSLSLATTAQKIATESKNSCITCQILSVHDCEERNMGAYLGVARGSETPPQFIHLIYKPPPPPVLSSSNDDNNNNNNNDNNKKIAIVGKGLLFDTGGYNIKTQQMSLMKFDCGGAAAVLGAARAIGSLQPEGVEAHFIVAACENMINSKAIVPSDILTASNGKTIEVLNTDAEGRLTLADALVFADKEVGAESIIELSTLTGACMISLGKEIAGLWTSDDDLAHELEDISKITGDKTWRMPLAEEYMDELTENNFADLSNIGKGRYGGAITAALFLQHFVDKKKPFAHIDIAGPVWNDKSGATGFGTRLVVDWIRRQGLSEEFKK